MCCANELFAQTVRSGFSAGTHTIMSNAYNSCRGDCMDLCVCCGQYVPEGTWVCDACRKKYELMISEKKDSR